MLINYQQQRSDFLLDEQDSRLQINSCGWITFRLLLWWMQYVFFWNHALFFISWSETARMSFVSSITKFTDKWFFRFNGETFKTEASSKFPHYYVLALGSYRNSPFVTGQYSNTNGLKTEIFDFEAKEWAQFADYPFSNSDRYVDILGW